jgi:hypothetical protein
MCAISHGDPAARRFVPFAQVHMSWCGLLLFGVIQRHCRYLLQLLSISNLARLRSIRLFAYTLTPMRHMTLGNNMYNHCIVITGQGFVTAVKLTSCFIVSIPHRFPLIPSFILHPIKPLAPHAHHPAPPLTHFLRRTPYLDSIPMHSPRPTPLRHSQTWQECHQNPIYSQA